MIFYNTRLFNPKHVSRFRAKLF